MDKGKRWPPRARFLRSALRWEEAPRSPWPQVAIAGRSNVGKSSLINALAGQKGLARTSATPGRTQTLNFFLIEERFLLVDLPGYGYARAPKEAARRWAQATRRFVAQSPTLKGVVVLFDIRRDPSRDDLSFVAAVRAAGRPILPVATKCDKVARGERAIRIRAIAAALGLSSGEFVTTSSKDGEGRDTLWERIMVLLDPEGMNGATVNTDYGHRSPAPQPPGTRRSENEP
jgi:GTP-binding protein